MRESKSRALPLGYTPKYNINGVNSGTRTHDFQSHNLALYQLNYIHHKINMVRQKGFEPLTPALEGRCSIQLGYWRKKFTILSLLLMERVMGIGPTLPAWKAGILPLNYTRSREIKLFTYNAYKLYQKRPLLSNVFAYKNYFFYNFRFLRPFSLPEYAAATLNAKKIF